MTVDHRVDRFGRFLLLKCGVYFFSRRVPKALLTRFQRVRAVLCPHIRNEIEGLNATNRLSVQLDIA